MSSCKICDHQLGSKSPGVQCGFCSCFYHAKCLSLPREQLSAFRDIPGVVYKCEDCREKKNTEYTSFVDAIKRLEALIKSLQDEIIQLKQEKNSDEAEKIIGEITDRQQRERNLIMFNVPEQQTGNLANRRAADLRMITEIISNIAPDIPTDSINAYRLGKRGNLDKPVPLKIVLRSRDHVFEVLKNKRKVRDAYPNISITTDKTAMQREQLKKTLGSLRERTQQGEEGLYVKYINGNPVILKSKN
jgi:hypothetical protein